jgi:hypothetical protein
MNRFAGCRSLQDLATVYSEISCGNGLRETVNTSRRIAEVSIRIADAGGSAFASRYLFDPGF